MFSALFQRPRFFFVVFCAPQKQGFLRSTNELNEEGKDASHKTHGLFSFFVVFFFLCCVSKAIYSSRRPLFERGEEPHQTSNTLSLSFSHVVESNERAQSTKKKDRACFASSVLSPPLKKTSPIRVKSPTTPGDKERGHDDNRRRRRRQQQQTTRFGERSGGTFGRRRRRRRRQRGNKNDPLRANDDALKQIMRRVFEEIKPFVTRHEPDVPEEDLPELSRTRDLSKADFTVQWSRFCAKRKVNPAEYVKNLSETIQRQIEEDGNRDGFIKSVQGVGPYMNIFVKRQKVFKLAINAIIEQGTKYGCTNAGQGKKVIIEHTSSNPNAPLHIGNLRNVMIGAHLARVMQACGCEVTQAFYVNDLGAQIGLTALAYSRIYTKIKPTMKIDQWIGAMYAVMNTCQELQQVGVQPGDLEVRRSFCSQFS